MRKVAVYSLLLIAGLVTSQFLPGLLGPAAKAASVLVTVLTLTALSFIMIHVGYEFDIDKGNLGQYGWDYLVAFTAASFPWVFCTAYFVFVMLPPETWSSWTAWKETLLAGRFAAPTSAGVLFSMLAAAGLAATWLYRKARVLAIFDDLDTVLLMIPLKMAMVGLAWQLGVVAGVMVALLWVAYRFLHRARLPATWPWVLSYAASIALLCEAVHVLSKEIDESVPMHIEVLLPAFVLGCVIRRPGDAEPPPAPSHPEAPPAGALGGAVGGAADEPAQAQDPHHADPSEQRAATAVSAIFMVLVGLNMPVILGGGPTAGDAAATDAAAAAAAGAEAARTVTGSQPATSWGVMALHVVALTVLSNLGKMFPAFCYRREAHWRERLAVAIGMWPRGEVGAGVLVISLAYGIGGPVVTAAMLSLSLNLLLTGVFILIVKRLLAGVPPPSAPDQATARPAAAPPQLSPA